LPDKVLLLMVSLDLDSVEVECVYRGSSSSEAMIVVFIDGLFDVVGLVVFLPSRNLTVNFIGAVH
jgi:hypothetical protein